MDLARRSFLQQAVAWSAVGTTVIEPSVRAAERSSAAAPAPVEYDVVVYGSTPGGIAAAIEAARRGCRVLLACPQRHPGGMAASGLCTTDAVRRHFFGGFVQEFVGRVRAHYEKTLGTNSPEWKLVHDGWYYEPSVAERVFEDLIAGESERMTYRRGTHLLRAATAAGRIVAIDLETEQGHPLLVTARTFVDGTYEGDLAAAAKVPYRIGREGRDEHGESLAGIHYMNWRSGKQIATPDTGEPSPAIQSYCARSIFTDDEKKRLPIEKPATYEEHLGDYLPLLDDFREGRVKRWSGGATLPGRKFEMNGMIEWRTSFNCPGVSWNWPDAERHHRARLAQFHVDHAAGMMWFLQHDPHVPDDLRRQVAPLGLHADEFRDTGGWPWQIYVRQGRRIVGRALVTQHNFTVDPQTGRTPRVEQPIALGEHSFDIHPCHDRRYAVDGYMEGVLWYPKKAFGPAQPGQILWGALLPRGIDNLVVPVAMSATHVAFSVLRMEPVWMTTGQLAGLAAAAAREQSIDVAALDPAPLPRTLNLLTEPPPG
jgi:ribulose 1,5-bisphosphate synthetase/thiazole synthase